MNLKRTQSSFDDKERVRTLLTSILQETELVSKMSETISTPDEFLTSISGMTVFRACGMSIQYVTESFVKIRNLTEMRIFKLYPDVPWNAVFGMRNFISHGYSDVDETAIFNTIHTDLPILHSAAVTMLDDLNSGRLDKCFK